MSRSGVGYLLIIHGGIMIYFVVNPHARSGKAAVIWAELEELLHARQICYTAYKTEYAGHAALLANMISQSASPDNPVTLAVLGGDGTVNEVYNGLTNHKYITLGYIPTGSGNDYARGLNLETDYVRALEHILDSTAATAVEYGILSDSTHSRRFAVSCGIGYDANVTYRALTSRLKRIFNKLGLGKLVYGVLGFIQIIINPKMSAVISIDGVPVLETKRLHFASVHVLKYEGGGFPFAPHARPSGGMLSVCVFHDTGRLGFARNLISSISEKHGGRKGVSLFQCSTFSIRTDKKSHVHTDGEDFGYISEMNAAVCSTEDFVHIL